MRRKKVHGLPQRFKDKIEVVGECWVWTGSGNRLGYGQIYFQGRLVVAHRAVWELMNGPIPDDLECDHLCRNRRCVNPGHIELVTHSQNILRADHSRNANAAKTHCPQGHLYDEANTQWTHGRRRHCRICSRASRQRTKSRKRELRIWQLLLDEDDEVLITFAGLETEIPDPDVWFGRVKV